MKPHSVTTRTSDARPAATDPDTFDELDRVALREAVALSEGGSLPMGAEGTIVGVWAGGQAFEVEFTTPLPALLTVEPFQIRRAPGA